MHFAPEFLCSTQSCTHVAHLLLHSNFRLCKMGFVFEAARTALADSKADLGKKDVFFRVVREAGTLGGDGDNLTDAIRNLNEQLRNCLVKETGEASVWKSPIRAKVGSWLPNIPDPESGDICTGYVSLIKHLFPSFKLTPNHCSGHDSSCLPTPTLFFL